MRDRLLTAILLIGSSALLAQSVTAEPTSQSASKPSPATLPTTAAATDLCMEAVDPYNPIIERARFFLAAGPDSEMDSKEFAATAGKPDAFVRSFDRWDWVKMFDKNGNGSLDWFEIDAYRKALRETVLASFDANKDGRLTGGERSAAIAALATGKVVLTPPRLERRAILAEEPRVAPAVGGARAAAASRTASATPAEIPASRPAASRPAGRAGAGNQMAQFQADMIKKYDADGDGTLNDQERQAARQGAPADIRNQMIARYDKDGDGKLSEEEQQAARQDVREQIRGGMQRMQIRRFDKDGDGKLNAEEQAAADASRKQAEQFRSDVEVRLLDQDGDGKVSEDERQAGRQQIQQMVQNYQEKARQQMDTNGDGRISDEERSALGRKMAQRGQEMMRKFTQKYDTDGDGTLNEEENKAMAEGMRQELETRRKQYDKDGDGKLSSEEQREMFDGLRQEMMSDNP